MVAYQPPDGVLATIGAQVRSAQLLAASDRVLPRARADLRFLEPFAVSRDGLDEIEEQAGSLRRLLTDKKLAKNDTPIQMAEVMDTMARVRAWLSTLRLVASVNLAADTPSLMRLASPAPELVEVYARDLLEDLEQRLKAAAEMKPRLEEGGLDDPFLTRGRKLAQKLRTAIGNRDIDMGSLTMPVRRLYTRKAQILLHLKRICRAGRLAFILVPERGLAYHLRELEPECIEAPTHAASGN